MADETRRQLLAAAQEVFSEAGLKGARFALAWLPEISEAKKSMGAKS